MVATQAIVLQIADAVTSELNAATLSETYIAERQYVARYELKDLNKLMVTVFPSTVEQVLLSRNSTQDDYVIDIAIQKRFDCETDFEIDPLVSFAQELSDYFRFRKLADYTSAVWVGSVLDFQFLQAHIDRLKQVTIVVRLTYRKHR